MTKVFFAILNDRTSHVFNKELVISEDLIAQITTFPPKERKVLSIVNVLNNFLRKGEYNKLVRTNIVAKTKTL